MEPATTPNTAAAPAEEKVPQGQVPQYKLTERAYLPGDKLAEAGVLFFHAGKPEHYMAPQNAAARAMVKKHGVTEHGVSSIPYKDPLGTLPIAQQPQNIT